MAIDTATDQIGLSLDDGLRVLTERVWQSQRHHTIELAPEVALMLRDAKVKPEELQGIAVASGPGSYTGLRIGMALAKGLALAHGIPLIGVPTLDILAAAQPGSEQALVGVIKAGRNRLAAVWYKWGRMGWQAESEPASFSLDELIDRLKPPAIICGEIEGARSRLLHEDGLEIVSVAASLRRPSYLAQVGRQRMEEVGESDPAALAPTYLGDIEGSDS